MPNFTDTLTEVSDTNLELHTSDSGHTYSRVLGASSMIVQGGAKLLRGSTAATNLVYISNWDPGGTDYSVTTSLTQKSATGGMCPGIRVQSNGDGYFFQRDPVSGLIKVFRLVAGVATLLGSATVAWGAGTVNIGIAISGTGATVHIVVTNVSTSATLITVDDTDPARFVTKGGYGVWSANVTYSATTRVQISGMTGTNAVPTSAPTNTVAPVISGTAAVGSTLTTTNGTWTDSPTSFAYQWLRDGSTTGMTGATSSTYVVTGGDAGHALSCRVTATNGIGSTPATSNTIGIPAAPVFSVAPAISPGGPYHTGDTITCSTGTASGGPTFAFQWFRGASPITGEVGASYVLVISDEGANISCLVTATNGGGSTSASSNTIVPQVTAPLSDDSFLIYYSGGASNTDPTLSLGGARGGTFPGTLNALFGPIPGTLAQSGGVLYRVIYIRNTHTTATAGSCVAFLESQLTHAGLSMAIAVPVELANVNVAPLANGTTAPSGVTWTTTTDPAQGAAFGNLGPGAYRGLYLRLTISSGTTPITEDDCVPCVQGTPA